MSAFARLEAKGEFQPHSLFGFGFLAQTTLTVISCRSHNLEHAFCHRNGMVPGPLPNTSLEHALSHCGNGAAPRSPPQHESGACALPPSRYHFLGFRTPTHGGGICAAPKDQLSSDDSTIGPTYASTPTESRINFQFAHPFSRRHRQWNIQLRRPT